jgi:hypothetical protein
MIRFAVIIHFLLSTCFLPVFGVSVEGNITFLSRSVSWRHWEKYVHNINDIFSNGMWVNGWDSSEYKPLFSTPCVWTNPWFVKYVKQNCADSLPNQGYKSVWKPKNHFLERFSILKFCEVMQGQRITIVGDSVMEIFFFTLLSTLKSEFVAPSSMASNSSFVDATRSQLRGSCVNYCLSPHALCTDAEVFSCGDLPSFSIRFVRMDLFRAVDSDNNETKMIEAMRTDNSSLLLFNAGLHYMEFGSLRRDLLDSLQYVYSLFPNISVVYFNSIAGHENCVSTFKSQLYSDQPPYIPPQYNWGNISHYNHAIRHMFNQHLPQVLYLNIFNATTRRIDSHPGYWSITKTVDCLHYCMPGPIDNWLTFLYNALLSFHLLTSYGNHSQHVFGTVFETFIARYADGTLIKTRGFNSIYWIVNGSRRVFPDAAVFMSHGLEFGNVQQISDDDLFAIPVGPPVIAKH